MRGAGVMISAGLRAVRVPFLRLVSEDLRPAVAVVSSGGLFSRCCRKILTEDGTGGGRSRVCRCCWKILRPFWSCCLLLPLYEMQAGPMISGAVVLIFGRFGRFSEGSRDRMRGGGCFCGLDLLGMLSACCRS